MNGKEFNRFLVSALFVVPTGSLDGWKSLGFNKIPQNNVSIIDAKWLQVEVEKSASPLIYKLPEIKKVLVQFNTVGDISKLNSDQFPEDFLLRIGLVVKGDRKLGWFQKKIAAQWVIELFKLAPENIGLDKIYFYNFAASKELLGQKRQHPKSDLMLEEVVGHFSGKKSYEYVLPKPLEVVAVWISIDGDDTKSQFKTTIESLILETVD